jgi:hypothetical protein
VVVPFAASGLKRRTFLLKTAVYCFIDKVTVTILHLSLIRPFNLDQFIYRRINLVKRRTLITLAAKGDPKVHRL